jgi:hypothetical protein
MCSHDAYAVCSAPPHAYLNPHFKTLALRKAGNADLIIKLMHSKIGIGYERFGSTYVARVRVRGIVSDMVRVRRYKIF